MPPQHPSPIDYSVKIQHLQYINKYTFHILDHNEPLDGYKRNLHCCTDPKEIKILLDIFMNKENKFRVNEVGNYMMDKIKLLYFISQ